MTGRFYERNQSLIFETDISWSQDGLEVSTPIGRNHYAWDVILSWVENATFIGFFISKDVVCAVPKRAFKDEAQLADLRRLLATHRALVS